MPFATEPNHVDDDGTRFWPYLRDPETLARPWAIPGTPGLEHRIGGIEKEDGTGNINYDPENHERMVHLRAEKIAGIANDIPAVEVVGDVDDAEILGRRAGAPPGAPSTAPWSGCRPTAARSPTCSSPTSTRSPPTSARCCTGTRRSLVPEMNLGQLSRLLRAEYLVDAKSVTKVKGLPVHRRRARSRDPGDPR